MRASPPKVGVAIVTALLISSSSASAQVPAGGEFRVNAYTLDNQFGARAAMAAGGDFVVVWTSTGQDGSYYGLFGRRFAASGTSLGIEFAINAYTTAHQFLADIAVGRRGDFVVVWTSYAQDGSEESVQCRRFDREGNPSGPEFQVNTFTTSFQYNPRIGRAADGSFVVAWTGDAADGDRLGISARRFDTSGMPIGGEFIVNTYSTGDQGSGDLAVDADGNFVAVWEDYNLRDGSGRAIFGQRFDGQGNRVGVEFQVNTYTGGSQRFPSVSMSPGGGFVVVWSSEFGDGSDYAVFARMFDAGGNSVGADFVVNSYTTGDQFGLYAQVGHDTGGSFVVTWESWYQDGSWSGSHAQRFDAAGGRRGAEFQANAYTTDLQMRAVVAADPAGNFLVAWASRGQDGSGFGVFAQRFGGLVPAALAVDTASNQVLEPGETVAVRPAWRNVSGATRSFAGMLAAITGPPGATYAITDSSADYGAVPDGATAHCADCYAVAVSDPPARPAPHWDAAAAETILPDAQGQHQRWTLHIGDSFTDVPRTSGFYRFVETLLHQSVTSGCTATTYCPASSTTREQMAVFVLLSREGHGYSPPACTTPVFADLPAASPFCRFVEELARRAVVSGCGGGNYCPQAPVTREQMAVFVLRTLDPALDPPACTTPVFADVPPSSPFCRWIEELARRGVVTGCGGGNYCPQAAVTREQMAVFLTVTFGLALYGP